MSTHQVGGATKTGLRTAVLKDLDIAAPRAKLPPRALPDDVRAKLGFGASDAPAVGLHDAKKSSNVAKEPAKPKFRL
jgi:hypothetical protein